MAQKSQNTVENNVKALFVMPLVYTVYPLQIAALSAYLKKNGHEVKYMEFLMGQHFDKVRQDQLSELLRTFDPDLVGFSSYEMSYEWIKEMSTFIKMQSDVPIIVGGYFATLSPDLVIEHPAVDIVCVGEGEKALSELLERMKTGKDISDIKSLYVKKNGTIFRNKIGNLTENLDELPFVDRTLISYQEHIDKHLGLISIMASKGCSYNCSYCSNFFLKDIYENSRKYVRFRSPGNIIAEIEECEKHYKFERIVFEDDMFALNLKWLRNFAGEYKKRFSYPFRCQLRPEVSKKETLTLLKDMGCELVSIGLEAGDERIRREVLRRNMSDKKIIDAAKNIKEVGIRLRTYNMVGIPEETIGTILKTIFLNLRIAPHEVQTTIYYPFKGTSLGDKCYKEGWIDYEKKKRLKLYANDSLLNHQTIPRPIIIMAKWINSATAFRSGKITFIKSGLQVLSGKLKSMFPYRLFHNFEWGKSHS